MQLASQMRIKIENLPVGRRWRNQLDGCHREQTRMTTQLLAAPRWITCVINIGTMETTA